MLNYYLGKRAADDGRDSRYPDIDFCKNPGAICDPGGHVELKWIGEFVVVASPKQTLSSTSSFHVDVLFIYCYFVDISSHRT